MPLTSGSRRGIITRWAARERSQKVIRRRASTAEGGRTREVGAPGCGLVRGASRRSEEGTWVVQKGGLVCLDVSRRKAGGGISRQGNGGTLREDGEFFREQCGSLQRRYPVFHVACPDDVVQHHPQGLVRCFGVYLEDRHDQLALAKRGEFAVDHAAGAEAAADAEPGLLVEGGGHEVAVDEEASPALGGVYFEAVCVDHADGGAVERVQHGALLVG